MVQETGDDWQQLSDIWISNGEHDCQGKIEIKITWEATTANTSNVVAGPL